MNEVTGFMELVSKRVSVRKYSGHTIERNDILACLDAARLAPSACNIQPWKFIVVDNHEIKNDLCEKAFGGILGMNRFVKEAPVIIVIVAEKDVITNRIAARIKKIPYHLLDIGAACEQFLLRATELGIGTCWLGWFNEKPVRKLLEIPRSKKIVSLISMGYPADDLKKTQEKKRKPLQDIYSFNGY